jgi:predicted ATP-grasp superfamily ATP-dependent carboligase
MCEGQQMKLDVLLTDGQNKHTYAILRALTEQNLKVGIIFNKKLSLSYYSKYLVKRFSVSKNILNDEKLYILELTKILKGNSIKVLLPVGNVSYKFITKHQVEIKKFTKVLVPHNEIMEIAQDKNKTFKFAESIGIKIPKTIYLTSKEELRQKIDNISFPCVIKKSNYNESGVIYCNNKKELLSNYNSYTSGLSKNDNLPIIQEYVEGKGVGYYALFNEGTCIAEFMHERIHEFPITGGASTLAKSSNDKELGYIGRDILEKLNWTGVAMVEFKKNKHDEYTLMEINPKFWGSLELSYVAGINFPFLVYQILNGEIITDTSYKKDVYFRWVIPHDLLWCFHSSKESRKEFRELKKNQKILNNMHYDDPGTIAFNILNTIYKLFKEKKYPHGSINK